MTSRVITLGEIMLRLKSPGVERFFQSPTLEATFGGGEGNVALSLANFGLDYATSDEVGYIPANYSQIVDNTGTGDAVIAAIMFGMVNGLPTTESIRLGAAAASITVQTGQTVVRDLSLDMLYDHLIV